MCFIDRVTALLPRAPIPAVIAAVLAGAAPAAAQEWDGELVIDGGAGISLVDWYGLGNLDRDRSFLERVPLRATGRAWNDHGLAFEAAYEATALFGRTRSGSGTGVGSNTGLRVDDLNGLPLSGDGYAVGQNLDRLNLFVEGDWGQAMIGRQAISHGSGRFFNPTDIFAPLTPRTTTSGYKQGVDALRLSRPFGEMAEAELYLVAHEKGWKQAYKLARLRAMFTGAEASLMAGWSLGEPTLGADFSGDLGGAGWYGEALVRFDGDPADRLRATAGIHNRFDLGSGLDAFLELHFNGVGLGDTDDYGLVETTPEWENGEIYLHGRWFGVLSLSYDPHPLITASVRYVQGLGDGSLLLLPEVEWEVTDWASIRAGASLGLGARPDAAPDPTDPGRQIALPNSEFGAYPNIFYVEMSFTY